LNKLFLRVYTFQKDGCLADTSCADQDDFDLNDSRKLKNEKILEKKIIEAIKVLLKENKANGDTESLTDI
jgi:hypothetical protein